MTPSAVPATVVPIRRGRPSRADELAMELAARRFEEVEAAAEAASLIRRLWLWATEHGPAAQQTVAGLDRWHRRHARRWAPEPEGAAA